MKVDGNIEKFYQYSFPMQTVLVTCNDEHGKTNVITIAWHTPISKKPPLYGISLAPSRYSHDLIKKGKEFVVNFVYYNMVEKAHFCATHSAQNLTVGDHTLFIGEVVAVQADENTFKNDLLMINKTQPLYYVGGNIYTTIDRLKKKEF